MSPTTAVLVVDYDPGWPVRFEELAARVRAALRPLSHQVEHVGSTAVLGLAAKPVIDLDVVVNSPKDVEAAILKLAQVGYVHEGDLGVPGREAFRSPTGEPEHHLYVLVDGAEELNRHLAFRNALRADHVLRDEYSRLKRSLAARHGDDRAAYADGKSVFVLAALTAQT